jgi:hypothetical protein
MAIFAFHPASSHLRRPDGIGFILAEGADEASARAAAQQLVGGTTIAEFAAVPIAPGVQPVAVQGLPVGGREGSTWPRLTRGGGFLGQAA